MKLYFSKYFSLKMLREKFKNALEISEKTHETDFLKNVATLNFCCERNKLYTFSQIQKICFAFVEPSCSFITLLSTHMQLHV